MSAELGKINFRPQIIGYIDSLPDERYKACYIALQVAKKLIQKDLIKITTPQELIDVVEAIADENLCSQ